MGIFFLFNKSYSPDLIVKQGRAALKVFEAQRTDLRTQLQNLNQRQAELSTILSPSPELEREHNSVGQTIKEITLKITALEEHMRNMQLAIFHAQQGDVQALTKLLQIGIPQPAH